jgi:hypothetical protein
VFLLVENLQARIVPPWLANEKQIVPTQRLKPADRSSPRAALETFLDSSDAAGASSAGITCLLPRGPNSIG